MGRFVPTMLHRLVVSKWDPTAPQTMTQITLLDRHAINRRFECALGAPASFTGQVWSNDPEINILFDDNFAASGGIATVFRVDYPFLNEGVRLLHWFRRENTTERWICRFGGFILLTEDVGNENTGRTQFTAWDPWQLLMRRPVYRKKCITQDCSVAVDYATAEEALMGPSGGRFLAGEDLEDVIREILRRTIVLDGPCGLDAGPVYGGTAFYNGTVEALGPLTQDLVIQQGQSVGQTWQQIMDTSLAEIVIRPIWDPVNRPGYVAELDIYAFGDAGDVGTARQLTWDRSGHDITHLVRPIDGRERANQDKFYVGGPLAGKVDTQTQTSLPSITRFGQTWNIETRIPLIDGVSVESQAARDLEERKIGHTSYTLTPVPEFTYLPFRDYDLGTYITVYHSNRLRQENRERALRIRNFTVDLSDEGVETVSQLELWKEV